MANEIQFTISTAYLSQLLESSNIYACIFRVNSSGTFQVWDATNGEWTTWDNSNIDDYDIALTESGHGIYTGDFPSAIETADTYSVVCYAGDLSSDDTVIEQKEIAWSGDAAQSSTEAIGGLTTVGRFQDFVDL